MTKKLLLCALLICCAFTLCACMSSPPDALKRDSGEDQKLISASTAELKPSEMEMTLYFRYGSTSYLAPERRSIMVQRNESLEKAVVEALIAGPGPSAASLSPLFPPGTKVLATAAQEDTLFVTFSEELLGRYADEPADASGDWKREGPLRRQLCLDSLSATLTEAGLCARVQVLVYRSSEASTSMRLLTGFLNRGEGNAPLPPLNRDESRLLTAYNTAALLMESWLHQDWAALYDLTAREGSENRPSENAAYAAFSSGRALTGYTLSPGSASYDGQTAVFTVNLHWVGDGGDEAAEGYPLLLHRESGIWKMDYGRLAAMMDIPSR